jgi:molecular chaperone DnaJ
MSKRDYYQVLGLNKNATQSDIKKSYKNLAKKSHPDVGGDEETFKEISEAYEILSDENKRKEYDTFGHNKPNGHNRNYQDMYGFGFNPKAEARNRKGRDFRINIKLTLEEIFNGGTKKIKYNRDSACGTCNSVGGFNNKKCAHCNGGGFIVENIRTPFGIIQNVATCNHCNGIGETYTEVCNDCGGSGIKNKEENIEISIPIGIKDGMYLNYPGIGQAIKNGTSGSLIIVFNELPHKTFIRDGNNLRLNLKVPYSKLVLGGKVDIKTIEGGEIRINIPEYNNIGDTLRISGKGMKIQNSSQTGDLMVILDIDIPKEINEETRELLEKLKNIENNVVEIEKG